MTEFIRLVLRFSSHVHARLGGCSYDTCERGITRGVLDMVLGLTIPMRYRSPSSIGFNDLRPFCEFVMPSETTVSGLLRIGITSNARSSYKSRIDMEKSNIFPAGSRPSHAVILVFCSLFLCCYDSRLKSQKDRRYEARMHTRRSSVSECGKVDFYARLLTHYKSA